MNPTPDRGKECLPPKKRESRQGSSEQRPPEDDFKPPAPLRSRAVGSRETSRETSEPHFDKDLLPPPPPPPLPPLSLGLPWPVSYPPSVPHPFLSGQVGERRGSGSPSWRDVCGDPPLSHHSRWLRGEVSPLTMQPPISVPSYKSPYPTDSREMWSYFNTSRRDYSPSLFSPAHLFAQPAPYPPDPLPESRLRYPGRRPNGLDGTDSRPGSAGRAASSGEYGNDSRARLDGSHANGRKRHQEDQTVRSQARGVLSREGPNAHSSPQDRDPRGMLKAPPPHAHASDTRTGKGALDALGGSASQAGAQIYYALGSMYSALHQAPQTYSHLSPSVAPPYPPPLTLRNSQHSPQGQHNSHGTEQERDLSPGPYRPHVPLLAMPPGSSPDLHPAAVLPHFAKGSLIELAGGRLKRVEELRTEDFLRSADTSPEFHLSTCTVLLISPGPAQGFNHLQVLLADRNTQELLTVLVEYPFFVRDRGWSSCCPQRTSQLYGLHCRQLSTGDVCLALTPTPASPVAPATHTRTGPRAHRTHTRAGSEASTHRPERMPPPPPPPPLPPPPPAPPPVPESQSKEQPRPRKRRWSAPELQGDSTPRDLPQGSKHEKQQ